MPWVANLGPNQVLYIFNRITIAAVDVLLYAAGDIEQGSALTSDLPVQQDAYLNVDMYRVDQVVRNLVTNAVGMSYSGCLVRLG